MQNVSFAMATSDTTSSKRTRAFEHRHENFQLFVILIIVFAMCICSIAFEWMPATAATPLSFANAFNFGCWFYGFSLFRHGDIPPSARDVGRGTVFMTSERAFLILFLFPVEMVVCWWALMVAPHIFGRQNKTSQKKWENANSETHSIHGFYDFCA